MKEQYWLITYNWRSLKGNYWHTDNDIHCGCIANWVLRVSDMPEKYVFLNAHPLEQEEYEALIDIVG